MTRAILNHRSPSYKHSPFLVLQELPSPTPSPYPPAVAMDYSFSVPQYLYRQTIKSLNFYPLPHPNLTNTQDAGIPHQVFSPHKSIFSPPSVFISTLTSKGSVLACDLTSATGTVPQVCSGWGCECGGEIPLACVSLQPELRVDSRVSLPRRFR